MTKDKRDIVHVHLKHDIIKKDDTLEVGGGGSGGGRTNGSTLKVVYAPKERWYHRLLTWITFGWYKQKLIYKCVVVKDETV